MKKIYFIMIVIFVFSFNIINCNAEEQFHFYVTENSSNVEIVSSVYNSICVNNGQVCKLVCKDGYEYPSVSGISFDTCSDLGGVQGFYITDETSVELKNRLQKSKCGNSGQTCFRYVANNYCDNWESSENVCLALKEHDILSQDYQKGEDIDFGDCESLLSGEGGDELIQLLRTVITIFKFIVPIILFAVSILDFSKAIFGGEEDMKKAQKKLIKRIIIAVVIFLIPTLLSFILKTANLIWPNIDESLCGILE